MEKQILRILKQHFSKFIILIPSVTFHFNPSRLNSGLREKNNFFFTLPCGALEGFKKALKAFRKPLEAAQRSVKTKIQLILILI